MSVIRGDSESSLVPTDDHSLDSFYNWAINRLSGLVTVASMAGNTKWQLEVLRFLFVYGHFEMKKKLTVDGQVTYHIFIAFCPRDSGPTVLHYAYR